MSAGMQAGHSSGWQLTPAVFWELSQAVSLTAYTWALRCGGLGGGSLLALCPAAPRARSPGEPGGSSVTSPDQPQCAIGTFVCILLVTSKSLRPVLVWWGGCRPHLSVEASRLFAYLIFKNTTKKKSSLSKDSLYYHSHVSSCHQ